MIAPQSAQSLPNGTTAEARAWQIRTEQTRACLRGVPVSVAVHTLTGVIVVVGLWDVIPESLLLIWGSSLSVVLLMGIVASTTSVARHQERPPTANRRSSWCSGDCGGNRSTPAAPQTIPTAPTPTAPTIS